MDADALKPAQLEKLRQILQSSLAEIQQQLEGSDETTRPVELDQQSVGRVSRIDAIQQQQMAIAGRDQVLRLAEAIRHALQRIENGSYGYCLDCGELINYARLEARPQAELCVSCQEKSES